MAQREGLCSGCSTYQGQASYLEKGTKAERGYPANWEKLRRLVLERDPICKACELDCANECDHLMPLERGGTNELANLQGLCKPCHSRKTGLEQRLRDPIEVMRLVREEGRRGRVAAGQG
jgi:5-methylcytosine-specific restriction protein A